MINKMVRRVVLFLFLTLIIVISLLYPTRTQASTAALIGSPYLYNFDKSGVVKEASSMSESSSPYWWVNSGAYLNITAGRGTTGEGALPLLDPWRAIYLATSPTDTDQGAHPQNIFRLLTRSEWGDSRTEGYFVIKKSNLSASPNRNASNGLLLFSRYQDSQNLYYMGVRVDGSAIIKKKKNSTYYTMAETKNFYPGTYNHDTSPNLLPMNKWIGLRSEVKNLSGGKVEIKLYVDNLWTGTWQLVASAIDDGQSYGGAAFTSSGYNGIRTDFMDVEFDNFRIRDL